MTQPTTRTFLTTLLSTLPTTPIPPTPNPLKQSSPSQKSVLLTLHVLYPNDLLPALDLLDRGLVTKLSVSSTQEQQNHVYYVRSAQQSTARFRDAGAACYEVRTLAWSCSCAAFMFSAFPVGGSDGEGEQGDGEGHELDWKAGGLSLGRRVPMCKHLLACVLAERGGVFGGYVKTQEVSVDEMAGWAAGWGG